jgi:hypothetical protein
VHGALAHEAVGAYFALEADDLKLAARIPAVHLGGAVEVRPCAK